jgi:FAD/FMN-containing dehydrogenase
VGRFYRHAQRLDPGSLALLETLKRALDPQGRVNPGLLGLAPL